ncbi:uncharacterized protein LOC132741518 [Ruditapes philippinarum]|uniref:uncharacterized protein LOC132741518 n=1 Tax=Ruditapes philippinarum TaxID=129788 RepID=UPI00295AE794|nr:uncharacterized protein LOC132741518 [Ruditapes philippinarum]
MICGPDIREHPVEKGFQFPESDDSSNEVLSDEEFNDSIENDPDWEPSEEDLADQEEDEEDDDENSTVWHDCMEDTSDPVAEKKFIVFESCLLQLFKLCHICSAVCYNIKKKVVGSMIIIESVCETGHLKTWRSQTELNGTPTGNLLAAGGIVFSGASPSKVLNFFRFINISMISMSTFTRNQKSFVVPAIANTWKAKQTENLMACRGQDVRVGGDARCCSPGHTAKYGSYTLMDLDTGLVLATELVQSNEVKNSNAMELEGLKRAISTVQDGGVKLSDITTDRHLQVRKYLRENEKEINHWFDTWHVAKSVKTKLATLSKKRGCEKVGKWLQSISNHLYFCAATSGGDGEMVEQKWLSVLNHITNKHEGHGRKFPKCTHTHLLKEIGLMQVQKHTKSYSCYLETSG